jgi:hypothetical protein
VAAHLYPVGDVVFVFVLVVDAAAATAAPSSLIDGHHFLQNENV